MYKKWQICGCLNGTYDFGTLAILLIFDIFAPAHGNIINA